MLSFMLNSIISQVQYLKVDQKLEDIEPEDLKVAKNFLVILKNIMRMEKKIVDNDLSLFISRYMKIGMGENRRQKRDKL